MKIRCFQARDKSAEMMVPHVRKRFITQDDTLMQQLQSVILRHDSRWGCHFDWMMEMPVHIQPLTGPLDANDAQPRLFTVRVPYSPAQWSQAGAWLAETLQPHRRAFLDYQGPLTRDRGTVTRVDQGCVQVHKWTQSHILLDVHLRQFTGMIELRLIATDIWRTAMVPLCATNENGGWSYFRIARRPCTMQLPVNSLV